MSGLLATGDLAYAVFRRPGEEPRPGARLGEAILDLSALAGAGLLDDVPDARGRLGAPTLNPLMAAGPEAWLALRGRLRELIAAGDADRAVVALADVDLVLPFTVADYVDFYSSLEHATNLGRLFRPGAEPLLPNWRHLPVGYHGRAGTVVVSGTPIVRPSGQAKGPDDAVPRFGPSRRLDIELELGVVIGVPSRLGEPVGVDDALDHAFGAVLVNDWSARDIQAWEYQPLGPFLGKSFATSLAPWVVPIDDLPRIGRPAQEPEPLPYLRTDPWAWDVALEVELDGAVISRTSARHLYWNVAQQIAHLTVNGASLRTGDLLASGTISGPEPDARGSLIELTWNGAQPLELPDGSRRTFLEDGDEVVLRGAGLGEVRGRIAPGASSVAPGP